MKLRLLSFPLVAVLAIALGAIAQEKKDDHDHTALEAKMEKAGKAWRAVRAGAADATKNEATLKQLAIVKENLTASLKLEPAKKATLPADQQAKFVADYQTTLKAEIALIEKIEAALQAGKNEEAAKLVAEAHKAQTDAHNQFKKKQKKQS